MELHVLKIHGTANSFVLYDNRDLFNIDIAKLARKVCDYRTGIGADGLILLENSEKYDLKMRIFNADGSEPEMCGNGIRCFALFARKNGIFERETMHVETLAGEIVTSFESFDGNKAQVCVDMGVPRFEGDDLSPSLGPDKIEAESRLFSYVSMGNPHAVTFVDEYNFDYLETGKAVENRLDLFPHKTNVEFILPHSKTEMTMRVWERGCGETHACGTGACASVVAATRQGIVNPNGVTVHLKGGDLFIRWDSETGHVFMTGPAEVIFTGRYYFE